MDGLRAFDGSKSVTARPHSLAIRAPFEPKLTVGLGAPSREHAHRRGSGEYRVELCFDHVEIKTGEDGLGHVVGRLDCELNAGDDPERTEADHPAREVRIRL